MNLIIYFTIYFIITSLLGWFANRPKERFARIGFYYNNSSGNLDANFYTVLLSDKGNRKIIKLKTAMDKVCDGK